MKNKKRKIRQVNREYLDVTTENLSDDKSKFIINIKNNKVKNSIHILVDCEKKDFAFIYEDDKDTVISQNIISAIL